MEKENLFMMIFRYDPSQNQKQTEATMAKMQQDWGSFIGGVAIQEKLVSTYQLGMEGAQISTDLSVDQSVFNYKNEIISGNMVIRANSIAEATAIAKECPILSMGGQVEVRSIIPM